MRIILLSGGSGKRLWPLSNEIRSKQFLKIFKNNGKKESMLQRTYRELCKIVDKDKITITTSSVQASYVKNQIGTDINICIEPCKMNTFPAIALACTYLKSIKKVDDDESIIICPVDLYTKENYFDSLSILDDRVQKNEANLVLMGVEPTSPSEKFGYIIPENNSQVSKVVSFKEKPNIEDAKVYIEKHALWNCGIFAFKLKYILEKAHKYLDFSDYNDLIKKYDKFEKTSFDYAVVEKESNIEVCRYNGVWKDIGTWDTLTDVMEDNIIGDALTSDSCENVEVINELNLPILCVGLKNMVVSASPDGILVSDINESTSIKPLVEKIEGPVRYAEKSWGSYQVIDVDEESQTVKVTLNPGHKMNYHSHERRDEVWVVTSGIGKTVVDGMEKNIKQGDVITMQAGCKHTVIANTELKLVEVQLGKDIDVKDKIKYNID